ncbi:nascent polypeptide-associated complex subunit alpha, muscle-specific form-like [Schistocerca americana]|uniref:nascent polypeptide-associated complex subunit alpha, muscle-specific form-like n=1 Tax=Schistocerca americana TaxID=7009 RepID=UPI001F5039D0|nr:nascent polypeptide-associated complex subunit alpha, muscle-specific form-like [Schistocerca americana]
MRRETSSSSSEDEEDTSSEEETSSSAQQKFQWLQEQMISFQQRLNELQLNVSAPKRKSQICREIQQKIYLLKERMSIIQQEMDTYQQNEGQQTEDLDPPDQPSVSPQQEMDTYQQNEGQQTEDLDPPDQPSVSPQHTPPQSPKYSPPPLEPRVLRPRTTKPTPGTSSRGRGRPRRSSVSRDYVAEWSSEDIPLQPLEQSAGYAVAGPSGIRRPSRKPRDRQSSDDDLSSGDTPKQQPDYAVAAPSGVPGPSRKRGRYRKPNDRKSSDNDSSSGDTPKQPPDYAVAGPSGVLGPSRKRGRYREPNDRQSCDNGLGKGSRAMEQQKPLVRVQGTPGNAGQMHHTAAAADGPARHLRLADAKRIQPRAPATVDDPTTERAPFASAVQEERQPLLRALLSAKPASESTIQSPVATSNVRPHCKGYRKPKTEWMLRAPLVTDSPPTEQQTVSDMLPELQRSERRRSSPTSETLESPTTQQQTSRFVNEGVTSSLDTLAATACAVKMQQSVSKRSEIQATDSAPPTFDSLITQQQTSTFVNKPEPMSGYSLETLAAAASLLELHKHETQRTAATTEFPKPPPRKSTPQTQKVSSFRRYLEPPTTAGNSLLPQPQLRTASATPTHSQLPSDNSSVQLVEADSGTKEKQAFARAWEDPHGTAARAASSVRGQFDNRAWYQPISGRPQSPLLTEVDSTTDPPRATRTEIWNPRDDAPQVSWPWTTTQESAAQMVPPEAIFSGESASQKKSDSLPPHYSLSSRPLPYLVLKLCSNKITPNAMVLRLSKSPPQHKKKSFIVDLVDYKKFRRPIAYDRLNIRSWTVELFGIFAEDRAGTHDTWQASFSVVPEMPKTVPPSVSRNGHQITSTDVMNPFIPLASRQTVLKAMHNHTCISKPSLNQMIAPDIDHMPNLMPPPNSTYVPKSLANKIPFWHESDVADVMPQLVSTCVPKRGRQKIRNLTSETEPSLQGTSAGTPSERRPRRPRGRPCRRGSARYPAQYSVVSTAQCSPQLTAQCCAQPAPTTPAQSSEQVTGLSSIRHAAQRPKTPLEKNREQFPQQAPPEPKMQQQRRRMGKNLGRVRGQRSAKYVAGTTVQPSEKLPVAVKPVPAEHRVKMLAPLLFNPPAIHFVVQKLHWTYLPRIATVYGDPRRAPQAIETLVDGPQEVPMPRPAHLLQLTHLFMKYSVPQCPPAPYAIPLRPPLERGGHQRKTSDVIQMADRATADLAVSVAISLSVREDPMSE